MKKTLRKELGLIEIDPTTVEEWKAWGAELMSTRHLEALETLKEEHRSQEHVFLLKIDEKHFLGYFTEGDALPANLEKEINLRHKELLNKSRIRKIVGTQIYSLQSPERL